MLARLLAIMVLLLLGTPPPGWAAEPAGATIVLQLPPSMSPDTVRGLVADLAAKGAHPAAPVSNPTEEEAATPMLMTGMHSARQIWAAIAASDKRLTACRSRDHGYARVVRPRDLAILLVSPEGWPSG